MANSLKRRILILSRTRAAAKGLATVGGATLFSSGGGAVGAPMRPTTEGALEEESKASPLLALGRRIGSNSIIAACSFAAANNK